jgi:hypothetical protein
MCSFIVLPAMLSFAIPATVNERVACAFWTVWSELRLVPGPTTPVEVTLRGWIACVGGSTTGALLICLISIVEFAATFGTCILITPSHVAITALIQCFHRYCSLGSVVSFQHLVPYQFIAIGPIAISSTSLICEGVFSVIPCACCTISRWRQ